MTELSLSSQEFDLVLEMGRTLSSSLDLRQAFARMEPLLQQLIGIDHLAVAVSQPGNIYDYVWHHVSLPEQFLAQYAEVAEHDFVRKAVAAQPGVVLRDHQMAQDPQELRRSPMYRYAQDAGANIEQVSAVMLAHEQEWSSGLSLYRSRAVPFSDRDAMLLQLLVPLIQIAIGNTRAHAALSRAALSEPVLSGVRMPVIWLDAKGSELARTDEVTPLLEQFFSAKSGKRQRGMLPQELIEHLLAFEASVLPNKSLPPFVKQAELSRLRITFLPISVPWQPRVRWALVFKVSGLPLALQNKLSPSLLRVASGLVQGLSNQAIAQRDGVTPATVRDQAHEIYKRLEVPGRKGLMALVWGNDGD